MKWTIILKACDTINVRLPSCSSLGIPNLKYFVEKMLTGQHFLDSGVHLTFIKWTFVQSGNLCVGKPIHGASHKKHKYYKRKM